MQVSRQLERRLELLRKHLPELERKMASAIIELTHARGRWKDQLAQVQQTKVICEQMEMENEQHAKSIQVGTNNRAMAGELLAFYGNLPNVRKTRRLPG